MRETLLVVSFLIEQDDKVLIVQEADNRKWNFPGGKVEEDETIDRAKKRELLEETGRRAVSSNLIRIYESLRPERRGVRLHFKTSLIDESPRSPFQEDIIDNRWVSKEELKGLVIAHQIRPDIYQFREVCDYLNDVSENGQIIKVSKGNTCPCGSGIIFVDCHGGRQPID